jgi:hypothetical protein
MVENKVYLDDIRTPLDKEWIVVRTYDEFVNVVTTLGLETINQISLDHDLDNSAMTEYYNNVAPNYTLDYSNILEKTGYHAARWLVEYHRGLDIVDAYFPQVFTHSANPIGAANIMGVINMHYKALNSDQSCSWINIPHTWS